MCRPKEERMEIDLIQNLDVPVEVNKDEFGPEIDLTLTLALPSCGQGNYKNLSLLNIVQVVSKASATLNGDLGENEGRQCSNCGILDTPTWRKGPDGPKTLCNSCGLRHLRSGRKTSKKRKVPRSEREQREAPEGEQKLNFCPSWRLRKKRARRSP